MEPLRCGRTRRAGHFRGRWAAVLAGIGLCFMAGGRAAFGQTSLLLADDTKRPRVTVSWPTREGKEVTLEGERPYRSPGDKSLLGKNIECYAALGGTRLDKGLANGKGAVVRVGLYKVDAGRPFFEDLADDAEITIKLERVYMNQPAVPRPKTGLMHLRYTLGDLKECGLGADARNLFVTVDPEDPIRAGVAADSGRFGALDGGKGHGRFTTVVAEDGAVSITLKFPYVLLRHIKDPYQRTNPGGFFEPPHFHIEMELLPKGVAEAEDAGQVAPPEPAGGEGYDDPGTPGRGGNGPPAAPSGPAAPTPPAVPAPAPKGS